MGARSVFNYKPAGHKAENGAVDAVHYALSPGPEPLSEQMRQAGKTSLSLSVIGSGSCAAQYL